MRGSGGGATGSGMGSGSGSGSVWTRDGAKALRMARAVETGVLSVNSNTSVRVATPFGGFKQSGIGRELGPRALDHYSELKTVYYATEER